MTLAARHWHESSAAAALADPAIAGPLAAHSMKWEAIGTGGGCEAWSTVCADGEAQIWICDPGQTLGLSADGWLVGLHPDAEWNDHWQADAATLQEALTLASMAQAARAFALGFRADAPQTPAEEPLFAREFGDYPVADMPAIPASWEDTSWHNDTCPSFKAPGNLQIFVDYAKPEDREMQCERFSVNRMDDDGVHVADCDTLLVTDDWQAVLDFVASYVPPVAPVILPQAGNLDALTAELNAYAAEHGLEPQSADEMAMACREKAREYTAHAEWLDDFCDRWNAEEERLDAQKEREAEARADAAEQHPDPIRAYLAAQYVETVGYDPFVDDPTIDPASVAGVLLGFKAAGWDKQ